MTIGNADYVLGHLQYEEAGFLPQYVIIVIGVVGGVLVLVLIIIISVCQWKRTKNKREVRRLRTQLAALENNVRNECGQGESSNKPRNSKTHLFHREKVTGNVGPLLHI